MLILLKEKKIAYRSKPEVKTREKKRKEDWNKKNPEMLKLRLLRRRAMKMKATVLPVKAADLREKAASFDGTCSYCGGPP